MNHITVNDINCTGCGNCSNACGAKAVTMEKNEEGFLFPKIDEEKCINCGKCRKVCLIESDRVFFCSHMQEAYIAKTNIISLYKGSASGGIFSAAAYQFLRQYSGAIVVGAAFENGSVKHIIIEKISEIAKLQNSKYVQSDLSDVFLTIKEKIKNGAKVLFCGTPCQVYALKLFLGETTYSLYTIDIICHGVPSPAFLEKSLKAYTDEKHIKNVVFRKKSTNFKKKSGFFLQIEGNKRFSREKIVASSRDPYYALFMSGSTFRESCYRCKFANLNRPGDITIGDCDSSRNYPFFYKKYATSTVIINSTQGQQLWTTMEDIVEFVHLDIIEESKVNHQLRIPSDRPICRDNIYDEINEHDIEYLRKKYAKPRDIKEFISKIMFLYFP